MSTPTGTSYGPQQHPGPGYGPNNNHTKNGFGSGATFTGPSVGVNVNINKSKSGGVGAASNPGQGVTRSSQYALPEPAFYSTADVRTYCDAVRAFCAYTAIEMEVGAEILKAALEQTGLPGDAPFQAKMRARRVARKLSKAAEALTSAAALAAGTWSAFQTEYSDVLSQQHQRGAAQRRPFTFN